MPRFWSDNPRWCLASQLHPKPWHLCLLGFPELLAAPLSRYLHPAALCSESPATPRQPRTLSSCQNPETGLISIIKCINLPNEPASTTGL